jgi:hypothetical protein
MVVHSAADSEEREALDTVGPGGLYLVEGSSGRNQYGYESDLTMSPPRTSQDVDGE